MTKNINTYWDLFQIKFIDKDSLLHGLSSEIRHGAYENSDLLLVHSYVDNLDSMSQMRFYIDNIHLRIYPEINQEHPARDISKIHPDSVLNTYFLSILSHRKYNIDSVMNYIIHTKIKSCTVSSKLLLFYGYLIRKSYDINYDEILTPICFKSDSCALRNFHEFKSNLKIM